ncbi:potassium channel family protein [Bacillus sp. Marseille-P3661]|uniref:potassium channel family protein n=1 Tax=Bacillus sp. Marseille-P3661 TaxID=1936234 RepID=UPI000C84CDFF|nr:potassium channel protein [Bacillus sp. Marseille-P3661]
MRLYFSAIYTSFLRSHMIIRLLTVIFVVAIIMGIAIHFVEPEEFPTIFDGLWWVIVTTSTVGYGDFVPTTTIGRLMAILLIFIGAGLVTFYMVTLSTAVVNIFSGLKEGSAAYKGEKHLVIVGWNEKSRNTINQIISLEPSTHIVLIDGTLEEHPLNNKNIYFIKGDSSLDETLKKANIMDAETVLITADANRNEHEADMQSILTLLAIKGFNPTVYCIIEILTPHQVNNAKRAGADELIETYLLSSYLMIDSLQSHGISDVVFSLLNYIKGSKIKLMEVPNNLVNKTFAECAHTLIDDYDRLLIGIKRGEEAFIHPPPARTITENDLLLVIVP